MEFLTILNLDYGFFCGNFNSSHSHIASVAVPIGLSRLVLLRRVISRTGTGLPLGRLRKPMACLPCCKDSWTDFANRCFQDWDNTNMEDAGDGDEPAAPVACRIFRYRLANFGICPKLLFVRLSRAFSCSPVPVLDSCSCGLVCFFSCGSVCARTLSLQPFMFRPIETGTDPL